MKLLVRDQLRFKANLTCTVAFPSHSAGPCRDIERQKRCALRSRSAWMDLMPRLHQFAGLPFAERVSGGDRRRNVARRRRPAGPPFGPSVSTGTRIPRARWLKEKTDAEALRYTQAVLLAASAARPDLSVLPVPATLKLKGAALERSLRAMLDRGLIADAETTMKGKDETSTWPIRKSTPMNANALSSLRPVSTPSVSGASPPAAVPVTRHPLCERVPSRKARGRAASWGACSMRCRARRGRRSKTFPPPRAGCRTPPAPPSPGSASAAMTYGSPRSAARKVYHLIPAV